MSFMAYILKKVYHILLSIDTLLTGLRRLNQMRKQNNERGRTDNLLDLSHYYQCVHACMHSSSYRLIGCENQPFHDVNYPGRVQELHLSALVCTDGQDGLKLDL